MLTLINSAKAGPAGSFSQGHAVLDERCLPDWPPSPGSVWLIIATTGNTLFSKGRYLPAAERYTEAITLVPADPAFAVLYVNRAMCYKKAGSRWQAVVQDAAKALSFNGG